MTVATADNQIDLICRLKSGALGLARFLTLAFQIGLFLIVVYRFDMESRAFLHLGILAFFGWGINYFLPQRYRLAFFVLLSLFGIELVFGLREERWSAEGLAQGAWLIGLGLGLIGLCHLPISFAKRIGVIAAVVIGLVVARIGQIPTPWSAAIWPVLASMFMFRLIVYLYQIRHDKKPTTVLESVGYFFMLPNVVFPLFPVVDYQTFRRSFYAIEDHDQIYQTGIHWMFRGVIHLILYRLVYQNFVNDAADVTNQAEFLQYMLWPFMLYLRVSGTFHLITGMMHLFGFSLPETHKLYFVSSSFTDFWRRINIYWKDFIMKVVYYPVYFKIRKHGDTTALVVATLVAFMMTWILHAYQWFWLRGDWLLAWHDGLFWAILGALVIANSLYEVKHGRRRRLQGHALTWRETLPAAARTLGVFVSISVLWSLWSSGSVAGWLSAWPAVLEPGGAGWKALAIITVVVLVIGISGIVQARGLADRKYNFAKSAASVTAVALLLIGISHKPFYDPLGPTVRGIMATLKTSELNSRDFDKLERGYYEQLIDVGGFNPELWEIYRTRPADWARLIDTPAMRKTDGLPVHVLIPSASNLHKGATVKTNRWGMRDRDYEQRRPPGTMRLAMLGASYVFGDGVENEENYGALIETRLNDSNTGAIHERIEVLNFGVGGYDSLQVLVQFENKVVDFEPQIILFFEHSRRMNLPLFAIAKLLRAGLPMPYAYLDEIVARAGIDRDNIASYGDNKLLVDMLRPFRNELYQWTYNRIVEICRARGITPVWVFMPRPERFEDAGVPEIELRMARDAGFITLDLIGAYGGGDLSDLWIARWDHHPNPAGHQMIADKLFEVLTDVGATIHLGLEPAGGNTRPSPDNEEKP